MSKLWSSNSYTKAEANIRTFFIGCIMLWVPDIYIGMMLTVNTTNILSFNVSQFDLCCCYMFRAYKTIIRQLYIEICTVIELLIQIHTSATCRIVY
jgi:hypothetical protein